MSFFWFLIAVILLIMLLSRKKPAELNEYQHGYWDGYRAFGDKVQRQLDQPAINPDELRTAVAAGYGEAPQFVSSAPEPLQEAILYEEPLVDTTPVLDPQARSLRNLNTILYMASFLLVAAGALFVSAAMPNAVKLIGVWLIIILFYGAGYALHNKVARLRPASVAFLGTGLALIPFAGFALQAYTDMGPNAAWLTTSIMGVVAYFVAAIRLQNQLVSYLAVAFVLSLVASSSSSISLALVWQFIVFIGVALAASSLALVRPAWVPSIFREPIERTGQFVTPLVLLASGFVGDQLKIGGFELIFTTATLYYLVVLLQTKRLAYETVLRGIVSVTALIYIYDWSSGDWSSVGLGLFTIAIGQLVYSLLRVAAPGHAMIERTWLACALGLHAVSFMFWQQDNQASLLNVIGLLLLGCASLAAMVRLRAVWFGSVGALVSFILPFVITRSLLQPALDWGVLAVWFTLVATLTIGLLVYWRHRSLPLRTLLTVAYMGYAVLAILTASLQGSSGIFTTIVLLLTLLMTVASYATHQPKVLIAAVVLLPVAIFSGWYWMEFSRQWVFLGTAWTAAVFYYLGYGVSHGDRDVERRTIFLMATWTVLGIGVLSSFSGVVTSSAAALTLILLAATIGVEGYLTQRRELMEIGVYVATLGLQRALSIAVPDINVVFYGHWWALTIAAMTWLYAERTQTRLITGLAFMSLSSATYALSEGGGYQLLFLIEHIALLLYGALNSRDWALWWGLAGSALAVVYLLGGFTFGSLGFLGLLMISIVVWRLLRASKTTSS